jgi:hypothetical protein
MILVVVAMTFGALIGLFLAGPRRAALGEAILTLLLIPLQGLSAVLPAIAYHDLRRGKEGADVAELLRAFD